MDEFDIDPEIESAAMAQMWLDELIQAGHAEVADAALFQLTEKLVIKPDQTAYKERQRRAAAAEKHAVAPNVLPIFRRDRNA